MVYQEASLLLKAESGLQFERPGKEKVSDESKSDAYDEYVGDGGSSHVVGE